MDRVVHVIGMLRPSPLSRGSFPSAQNQPAVEYLEREDRQCSRLLSRGHDVCFTLLNPVQTRSQLLTGKCIFVNIMGKHGVFQE